MRYRNLLGGRGRPSLSLSFLGGSLDSRLTTSGGANGTRVNSAGVIVAATCPRFDYDPVTLAAAGLIREEAKTNELLNSKLDGTSLATQSVTVTAAARTLSFYGTGTVTLSGVSTAGPLVGSGVYPTRSTLTFTPTAGSLTLTVTGTVQFAQLELGSFATSFIPTAGATVTRTADSISMIDANFSDWFNASAGTMVAEFDTFGSVAGQFPGAWAMTDGTVNNAFGVFGNQATSVNAQVHSGGVSQFSAAITGAPVAGTIYRTALGYAASDFAATAGGASPTTQASGTVPTVNRLIVGAARGGAPLNGHIRSLKYYNTRLPNATLQALTA